MKTYHIYPTKDQEELLQAFLETNEIEFFEESDELPQHVLDGIKKGQEDIAAGRFITFDEIKKKLLSR